MSEKRRKRIVGLLGVGFDCEDDHIRITRGSDYEVIMGSEESHEYIHGLVCKIEKELEARGLELEDLTPEKLKEIVQSISK